MSPHLLQGKRKKTEVIIGDEEENEQPEVAAGNQKDIEGKVFDLAVDMTSKNAPAKKICTRYQSHETKDIKTEPGNSIQEVQIEQYPSSVVRTGVIQETKPKMVSAPATSRQSVIRCSSSSSSDASHVSSHPPPSGAPAPLHRPPSVALAPLHHPPSVAPAPLPDRVDMINTYDVILNQIRIESDLLRQEGSMLSQTGDILKQHADFIDMYVGSHMDEPGDGNSLHTCTLDLQEVEKPLNEAPLFKNIFKLSNGKELDPAEVADILSDTKIKLNNLNQFGESCGRGRITDTIKEEAIDVKYDISEYESCSGGNSSLNVFSDPYMNLTMEETHSLDRLVTDTKHHLKECCPVSLWEARLGLHMGTLNHDEMLKIFTLSRKAQSFYHYKTMFSMPYFNELTTRLIAEFH